MTTLRSQLNEMKNAFMKKANPPVLQTMDQAIAALKASGIEARALGVGQRVPDVALADVNGQRVNLSMLWQQGPLVLTFYRGGWCPYCNLELREWQRHLAQIQGQGAQLVAISPQNPDNSLTTRQKNELDFVVLSDSGLEAAHNFGLLYELSPELVSLYRGFGIDLALTNGNGRWSLPIAATYVIDQDGVVVYAWVDADYRNRAEPAEVLAALPTEALLAV
ncbi:MAG: hypothetical protein RL748_4155 [Pseudomonadota bacterium]|jgi:peroxiredoxin